MLSASCHDDTCVYCELRVSCMLLYTDTDTVGLDTAYGFPIIGGSAAAGIDHRQARRA